MAWAAGDRCFARGEIRRICASVIVSAAKASVRPNWPMSPMNPLGGGPVFDAEFTVDVLEAFFDGSHLDGEDRRDGRIRLAPRHPAPNLAFPLRESLRRRGRESGRRNRVLAKRKQELFLIGKEVDSDLLMGAHEKQRHGNTEAGEAMRLISYPVEERIGKSAARRLLPDVFPEQEPIAARDEHYSTAVLQFPWSFEGRARWRFLGKNATQRSRFCSTPIGEPL